MAGQDWRASDRVAFFHALHALPSSYDFHAVLRRLESLYRQLPRWGEAARPSDEPLRLGQEPSLAFQRSTVTAFEPGEDGRPGRLWTGFLGLLGPSGPLPLHFTDYVRSRLRHSGDATWTAFLNLFNHRMLALFQRAWTKAHPTVARDRPESNPFDDYVGALFGLGMPEMRKRDLLPDAAKLQYAGLLSMCAKNADSLQSMLADYFRCPVRIEQFVGQWVTLPAESRWRLGWSSEVSTLGRTSVLGSRIWRRDQKFRVVLGPLQSDDFRALLPGNPRLGRLSVFVRTFAGDEYDWDVRLILAEDASRQAKLGRGDRLGLYTQLGRTAKGSRRDDIIIHPASFQTQRSSQEAS